MLLSEYLSLYHRHGDTLRRTLNIVQDDCSPASLAGAVVTLNIREREGGEAIHVASSTNGEISIVDASAGIALLSIDESITTAFVRDVYWLDLVVTKNGDVTTAAAGMLFVDGSPSQTTPEPPPPPEPQPLDLRRHPDVVNTYNWICPKAAYDPDRNRLYFSGVDGGGVQRVCYFDLTNGGSKDFPIHAGNKDDHNTPAFLVPSDKPPIVAYRQHSTDTTLRIRVGSGIHAFDTLGAEIEVSFPTKVSYPHLFRKPGTDTVGCLVLQEGETYNEWWLVRSTDWGQTWGTPVCICRKQYIATREVAGILHVMTSTWPQQAAGESAEICYFRVNLDTGAIANRLGTQVPTYNWWTTEQGDLSGVVMVTSGQMTTAFSRSPGVTDAEESGLGLPARDKIRSFDVHQDGSVLFGTLARYNPELGVAYKIRRWTGSAYVLESLVNSGKPFGYDVGHYVGGMAFGTTSDEVFLVREANDVWSLERWTRGDAGWQAAEVLISQAGKLGRVQTPQISPQGDYVLVCDYRTYPSNNFNGYFGDQLALKKTAFPNT